MALIKEKRHIAAYQQIYNRVLRHLRFIPGGAAQMKRAGFGLSLPMRFAQYDSTYNDFL